MATTELEIFQLALSYVGSRGQAKAGSEERRLLDIVSPETLNQLSVMYNWSFNQRTAQLVQVAPVDPELGDAPTYSTFEPLEWGYAYEVPSDCLMAWKVLGMGKNASYKIPFRIGFHDYHDGGLVASATQQQVLFCDEGAGYAGLSSSNPPSLQYGIVVAPGESIWFDEAWAMSVAARIAIPLMGRKGADAVALEKRAQYAIHKAISQDVSQRGPLPKQKAHHIRARS